MNSALSGPRSSTPKKPRIRQLPNVPNTSLYGSQRPSLGRRLPPIPTAKQSDALKKESLQEVQKDNHQRPKIIRKHSSTQSSSLPFISSHVRQLPKLPDKPDINRRHTSDKKHTTHGNKGEERKERLHDVYKQEADDMFRQGQFEKAIELYNAALKVVRNNKKTYTARSRCHKEMGNIRKSLQDVETALSIDPLYHEALFQKGELLFHQRDFESALIYYNKGMQQRPEMKSFHDRIAKTQDEMLKTGSKLTNKLIKSGELSMVLPNKIKTVPAKSRVRTIPASSVTPLKKNPFIHSSKRRSHNIYQKANKNEKDTDEKRIREALGQMYNDKMYLDKLVEQAEILSKGSADLCTIAEKGLNFLYDRVLFWVRQESGASPDSKATFSESLEKTLSQKNVASPRPDLGLQVYGSGISVAGTKQEPLTPRLSIHNFEKTKLEKTQSIRSSNTQFFGVLNGQKLELNDSKEKKRTAYKETFIPGAPQLKEELVVTKEVRFNKEFESNNCISDSDSGINISFSSCKDSNDPDQFDPMQIRTIVEEYLTPIQSPDKKILKQRRNIERRVGLRSDSMLEYIASAMDAIESAFVGGRYKDCVGRARPVLAALNRYNDESEEALPNTISIEAKLHSYIGNAAIEMRDYPTALHHHQRDLEIGEDCNDDIIISRALGNLGRIFVFKNQHQEALELFSRKIPLCKSNVETAWLYHEIGNCFLVLTQYAFAREAARRSIEAAEQEEECSYQLQSCVLKGVAEVKLREYHAAFNTFEKAMKQARLQGDTTAEDSIREALVDVNERILEEIRQKEQMDERQRSRNSCCAPKREMMESLPELRELSSFNIYEDDGPVSLTETRCDTYDLQSELGQFPHDLETAMTGSIPHLRTPGSRLSRLTPESRRLSTCNPQSSRRSLLASYRSNTVY